MLAFSVTNFDLVSSLTKASLYFTGFVDFLILPYWEIELIPEKLINLVINIRSMMEMTKSTIDFYFKQINRIISDKGSFVCINRYQKNDIILKNYPFDLYWKVILSQQSHIQNHIH